MGSSSNFISCLDLGERSEKFVRDHYYDLTSENAFHRVPMNHSGANIEGCDILAVDFDILGPSSEHIPEYVPIQPGGELYNVHTQTKTVEVKGSYNADILRYSLQENWKMPTFPFELWSSDKRKHEGWLIQMANPKHYNSKI